MKAIRTIFSGLVALLVPLALIFLGIRLLLTHAFLEIEYRLPGFPADGYGFTRAERLHFSKIDVDYLLDSPDVPPLASLTFPDGSPLYNSRELSHLQDVKNVLQPVLYAGYSVWFLLLVLAIGARVKGWWPDFRRGLQRGGWLTVALVALIGLGAGINFWKFFTIFHTFFFEGNTWLFYFSDTLIRLFPMRFWQDVFVFQGILLAAGGLGLGLGLRRNLK